MIRAKVFVLVLLLFDLTDAQKGAGMVGDTATDFFKDCVIETEKMGPCFIHPTNKMRNCLNQCKCETYQMLGGKGPEIKNGKKQKCKPPETISILPTPLKELAMMPVDFRVKVCFWKQLGLVEHRKVNYENFKKFIDMFDSDPKVKEALKGNVTACNNMDPLPEVPFVDRIPKMKDAIDEVMGIEDFKKTHCMGQAFGKICEDVTHYNFEKFIEKLLTKVDIPVTEPTVSDVTADVPEADVPKADVPKADVPEADVPAADVPKADVPEADVPKADVSKPAVAAPVGR